MPTTLPKVEALLGSRLEEATEASIKRLVDLRAVEDADLDFKREPHDDGEKLAADVSAMANTVGGVLVVGVEETDGAASSLVPVPLTDDVSDRMKQWLAEYLAPYLATDIRRVPSESDATNGYYLVVVPRSANAPHAVASRRKGTLRYYQRDGGRNRPLAESEVADAYRNRFRGERQQVDKMQRVRDEGAAAVRPEDGVVWLAMSVVPTSPGLMVISGRRVTEINEWARRYGGHRGDGPFEDWSGQVTTGVGRLLLSSVLQKEDGRPKFCHVELHKDGGGFAACELFTAGEGPGVRLLGADMVLRTAGLLRLLVDHATMNTGANGDALARCELLSADGVSTQLGYFQFGTLWKAYSRTRALAQPPAVETRAVSLDAIAREPVERLAATRLLMTDIVHAFGLPEVLHVTPEGHLNATYWDPRTLDSWASMTSVPRVEQEIRY